MCGWRSFISNHIQAFNLCIYTVKRKDWLVLQWVVAVDWRNIIVRFEATTALFDVIIYVNESFIRKRLGVLRLPKRN